MPKTLKQYTQRPHSYAYLDNFGRLFIDTCPDPGTHLMAQTAPDEERRTCQVGIEKLLPPDSLNKKGKWIVTFEFEPEEG